MNFATWSIRNPVPAVLLFILLTLAGLYGFRELPIANLPDLDLPSVTISLTQPGAAPAQLETEVARKVETRLPRCLASSTCARPSRMVWSTLLLNSS